MYYIQSILPYIPRDLLMYYRRRCCGSSANFSDPSPIHPRSATTTVDDTWAINARFLSSSYPGPLTVAFALKHLDLENTVTPHLTVHVPVLDAGQDVSVIPAGPMREERLHLFAGVCSLKLVFIGEKVSESKTFASSAPPPSGPRPMGPRVPTLPSAEQVMQRSELNREEIEERGLGPVAGNAASSSPPSLPTPPHSSRPEQIGELTGGPRTCCRPVAGHASVGEDHQAMLRALTCCLLFHLPCCTGHPGGHDDSAFYGCHFPRARPWPGPAAC